MDGKEEAKANNKRNILQSISIRRNSIRRFLKKKVMKNYHEILGVQKGASKEEIKKAYRRQAIKYHPDKNTEDTTEKFREVTEAYNELTKERREVVNPFEVFNQMFYNMANNRTNYVSERTTIINGKRTTVVEILRNGQYERRVY